MYLSACTVAANKLKISVVYNTFISYSWVCGLGNTLLGSAGLCWAWSLVVVWVQIYSNCPHFGNWTQGTAVLWGMLFRGQSTETQENEQKYGISLKSFTWTWHNATAAHIFFVPCKIGLHFQFHIRSSYNVWNLHCLPMTGLKWREL